MELSVLLTYAQGQFVKYPSIITDENVITKLRAFLGILRVPLDTLWRLALNRPGGLLSEINGAPTSVSVETARRWMVYLGFTITQASKSWFTDGHKRSDAVAAIGKIRFRL